MTTKPMSHLYEKVKNAGFTLPYIKKLLPDWWDDDLAKSPSGKQFASLFLSKRFSICHDSFKDDATQVVFNLGGNHKFKHRVNVGEDDLNQATAIAYSAARIAAENFKVPYDETINLDWKIVRGKILEKNQWVSLSALVDYCHSVGIPVVFLKNFPPKCTKMAGIALRVLDRPVIVLTQSRKYGYMLFDLAHELGHIAKGHVNDDNGDVFVDRKIDSQATDIFEAEANAYAFGILSGKENLQIGSNFKLNATELASASQKYGYENQIDPTHIILNYGYMMNLWPVSSIALKIVSNNGQAEADQDVVRKSFMKSIDYDVINDDDLDLIEKLCGE
ncbi:TPA: ImmA/IrrE family metallo-endopeptidase [Proteus mirabilis]|uniref:ImmA/IrrE family metallo-endopeptidase n=1 Tax=Proteus terrae TaxID=1574161 RepID=UPI001BA0B211|nr:ImmA/IrrE family metallo-endopeptidase [Proteus mirabilis]